ncbi:hypothetical protein [Clostridium sardiniense]|uniref:hypothetical protein n=1 Tax=Clostridium sardiniense TaxID=29369 RepID=UPI001957064F|nr:hypothetical protein [Clostridium sardiniense]MBM7836347.1 hypothetical protein [Clostridium sardiniense]
MIVFFINAASNTPYNVINISNMIDKSYLSGRNIEYIVDNNEIRPIGIINGNSNYMRFYIVNDDEVLVDSIINTIEKDILIKLSLIEN